MARSRNRTRTAATTAPVDGEDTSTQADAPEAEEGRVVMLAPEGSTGCSHNGENFEADDDGFVQVPPEAVAALLDHGFTLP